MTLLANDGLCPKWMVGRSGKVIFLAKREANHRHRGVAHDSTRQKYLSDSCFPVFLTITLSPPYSPFIPIGSVREPMTARVKIQRKNHSLPEGRNLCLYY